MAYLFDQRSSATLGVYYRPNQALDRGVYGTRRTLAGFGQQLPSAISVNPTLLFWGGLALVAGMFLFGAKSGPQIKKRKIARLASRREALTRQLKELES